MTKKRKGWQLEKFSCGKVEYTGTLKFSKEKQISGFCKQNYMDADRQFKLAVACVYLTYLRECLGLNYTLDEMPGMDMDSKPAIESWEYYQLDHITNKTHGERYNLKNAQLISPVTHDIKTDSGKYTDYRSLSYKVWLLKKIKERNEI
jgi:hypothetical protein